MIRRFNRYELKYIMPVEQCDGIIADLKELTTPDEHGGEDGYRIVSLYYDSPALDFFWAKVEGIKFRRKIRIRIYPGTDIESVDTGMVEIKQRINRTVQKRRLVLPLSDAEQLCAGSIEHLTELDNMDQQVASEVQYLTKAMHLAPTCITAYMRKAFVGGRYDSGLRITFDTDLSCRTHALKVNQDAKNHRFAPADWCVMEVKANDAIPDWVTSLLARHRCPLQRISKYCAGLAMLNGFEVMPLVASPFGEIKE